MRDESVHLPLDGIVLPDARTGEPVDLAASPGVQVLTLIRHRY
jgi:hypothetical protein